MADATDDIRQEVKKGRQDIADTRAAITEKLAILEDRVLETVSGVKDTFDLHSQVKQRPWLIFSGALLVGYALGRQGNIPGKSADPPGGPAKHAHPQPNIGSREKSQMTNGLEPGEKIKT